MFHWAASFTAGAPPLRTGVVAFTLVAVPTVLMGSTLPILVSYTVRLTGNVGTSVGGLYAANTLGAIVGAAATGFLLVPWLGSFRTVALAAAANVLLAVVLELRGGQRRRPGLHS